MSDDRFRGPWNAPHAQKAEAGTAATDVHKSAVPRRRIALSSILFALLVAGLVGGRAYKDLSRPEAWDYWRDYFISPKLTATKSQIDGKPALAIRGHIGAAAASWLRAALDTAELGPGDFLVLSSPGGQLDQAMIMGEIIRSRGLTTVVGRLDREGEVRPSYCASACVFAFAGGKQRLAQPGSRFGVHRFSSSYQGDAAVSQTQRTTGQILTYLDRMGISPKLVERMSRSDEIDWLGEDEAAALGLVTTAGVRL